MKFFVCSKSCSPKTHAKGDAKKMNYRCAECFSKLKELELPYEDRTVGNIFEKYNVFINITSALLLGTLLYFYSPTDFGGTVTNPYLQYIYVLMLISFMQIAGYWRFLLGIKNSTQYTENNLSCFKAWLLATFGVVIFIVVLIFT